MSQIKLDYLSVTAVSGNDAETFLQSQLTADLAMLALNEACFAAYCRPTGNVLAVMLVIRHEVGFSLIASAELMGSLVAELSKFVLRAEVTFEQQTEVVVACPELRDETHSACVVAGRTSLRYCIQDSHDDPADMSAIEEWRAREIQSGVTWLNSDTSDQFIPQMLGLEKIDALSFQKGCFPGQEVIARVRYLGKLKRRPVVVEIETGANLSIGTKLEVSGENKLKGTAIIADTSNGPEGTTCLLVARIPEGSVITSIQREDQHYDLKTPVQT